MQRLVIGLALLALAASCNRSPAPAGSLSDDTPSPATIYPLSKQTLRDKNKGGWAGKTIGVTYGGSSEFRYCGTWIKDYTPIPWDDGIIKSWFLNGPGLYDDIYVNLTFMSVIEKYGMSAPADSFALAFARAGYPLWHANQAARYNILHHIMPPKSGFWRNNPHADDIDFQIEADFAGLMSPGMINTSSRFCDKVGHIMNYGDGWYGGVFVAAMYSVAFCSNDIRHIVTEALKEIPEASTYHQCISDVIGWHDQFPGDWHQCWLKLEEKWGDDLYCPEGVFQAFNIDAKMNSAYVVIGLLYGNGDFGKSIEIAARCGQDADCNPSTAAGILGTMLGYSHIPGYWTKSLCEVEQMNFIYTGLSLEKVYEIGFRQACRVIEMNYGKTGRDSVKVLLQLPKAVNLEQSFNGLYPTTRKTLVYRQGILYDTASYTFGFNGTGLVVKGEALCEDPKLPKTETVSANLYIDGKLMETASLPLDFNIRKNELFWNYNLPETSHHCLIRLKNPQRGFGIRISEIIGYAACRPAKHSGK